MSTPGDETSTEPTLPTPTSDRHPAPAPQAADVSAQKVSSIEEAVKAIEERIEKRTAQLKKLEKWIEAWGDMDDGEDTTSSGSPRLEWLKTTLEDNEEARLAGNLEERVRVTKAACVYLSKEMVADDYAMSKSDAQKLVQEFSGQVASLKDFLNNSLRALLNEGAKNLKSRS